jgi:hypothetical protein
MKEVGDVPSLVDQLYKIVSKFEALFPRRHFTLDGHLVGSIGEVLAAYYYDLKLAPSSMQGHDADTTDGIHVEIKTTQRKQIGLRSESPYLLVLQLQSNGTVIEIYNGPGKPAWDSAGKLQKNGQRPISITTLQKLMEQIPQEATLPKVRT